MFFVMKHLEIKSNYSGLPPGFKLTEEILNAEKPTLPPPINIHYNEKHVGLNIHTSCPFHYIVRIKQFY